MRIPATRADAGAETPLAHAGLLTAAAVHEVNNLVCALRAHAEIGLSTPDPEIRQAAFLAIREASDDMGAWFRGFIEYAKGGPGRVSEFEPADAIERVLRLLGPHLAAQRVRVRREVSPVGRVPGPESRLRQVLVNLILNSTRATGAGGEIEVRLGRRGPWAEIALSDDGPGLPEEVEDHLFEPFPAEGAGERGRGLGLFVTRRLVADMGGHIGVRTRAGAGTRFTILIPRAGRS